MESTKNSDVRANNRKRIVNTLFREGAITKQELAQKLDISLPTITLLFKELAQKGLITKGEVLASTGGRKPVRIAPVYDARYAIGAEFSMHELRIVLVDLGANVVVSEDYPCPIRNTADYWREIDGIFVDFIARNVKDRDKLLDIGIALQTPMQNGMIVPKKNLADCYRLDLDMVKSCLSMPVNFCSSAKVAAIAQVWSLHDRENFVFVSLGSYIGGAIIYNSVIVDGDGPGGDFEGVILSLGNSQRKIADYCTTSAICSRSGRADLNEFFEQLRAGNADCDQVWQECLDVLSIFLHNLNCMFGWKTVIGGAMCPYLEEYQQDIQIRLEQMNDYEELSGASFKISDLGKHGAAVGAALLPIDRFFDKEYEDL